MNQPNQIVYTKPPAGVAKQTFSNVVAAAVMAYQLHNRDPKNRGPAGSKTLPTVDEIDAYCRHDKRTVLKVIATDEFMYAMRERGIFWDAKDGLTPEQVYCIGILTDPSNKRDMAGKLRQAGVTYHTYRNWLKQPTFARAIKQVGEDMLGDHMSDVHTALMRSAIDGNMKAVEIYYQMTGRNDPSQKKVEDLQRMVSMLLETIFRHVRDTDTLASITADFEKVMQGKSIEADLIMDADILEELPNEHEHANVDSDNSGDSDSSAPAPVGELDLDLPPNFFDYQPEIEEL